MWFVENHEDIISLGLKIKEKIVEKQSEFQKIAIYDTIGFGKLLTLDDIIMLSETDEFVYHEMIIHMPLVTHQNARKICVIGGGDGGSIREALKHNFIEEAVLCEIDREVVKTCQDFMPSLSSRLSDSRVKLHFEDGFQFLDRYENYFDIIITDSSDPIGPGVNLFRKQYYELVKKALKPDGIMVSQSESPWIYQDVIKEMTRDLCQVFRNVETYTAFVPLYPTGFWTFTFASDYYTLKIFDQKKSRLIAENCQYYNEEIHKAALALPNFVRKVIKNQ